MLEGQVLQTLNFQYVNSPIQANEYLKQLPKALPKALDKDFTVWRAIWCDKGYGVWYVAYGMWRVT